MINIENADMITSRLNCSYKDALRALEACDGDVLKAIVFLEEEDEEFFQSFDDEVEEFMDEAGGKYKQAFEEKTAWAKDEAMKLYDSLKDIIKKANANRVVFYKDEKVILDMPITVGALGALFFLPATLVGTGVALISGCSLKLFKKDGGVIDISNFTKETIEKVKESLSKKDSCDSCACDEDCDEHEEHSCSCGCSCSGEEEVKEEAQEEHHE